VWRAECHRGYLRPIRSRKRYYDSPKTALWPDGCLCGGRRMLLDYLNGVIEAIAISQSFDGRPH